MSPTRLTLLLTAALLGGRAPASPGPDWREAPAFLPLFTPRHAPAGAYHTYVSAKELDSLLRPLRHDASAKDAPGTWQVQAAIPFDAFGQSGGYDRWKVARLYGARRARVARGVRTELGRVVESWTLISPYPDAQQRRLEPGTLLIVLRLP